MLFYSRIHSFIPSWQHQPKISSNFFSLANDRLNSTTRHQNLTRFHPNLTTKPRQDVSSIQIITSNSKKKGNNQQAKRANGSQKKLEVKNVFHGKSKFNYWYRRVHHANQHCCFIQERIMPDWKLVSSTLKLNTEESTATEALKFSAVQIICCRTALKRRNSFLECQVRQTQGAVGREMLGFVHGRWKRMYCIHTHQFSSIFVLTDKTNCNLSKHKIL